MEATVLERLAYALAGQEKPHNAKVIVAYSQARDIGGLTEYLKRLAREE